MDKIGANVDTVGNSQRLQHIDLPDKQIDTGSDHTAAEIL